MKRCPTCQSTYTDDSLRFCLQDGTVLLSESGSGGGGPVVYDTEKTLRIDSPARHGDDVPPPTEILSPSVLPTAASPRSPATTPQQSRPTEHSAHDFAAPPPTRKSNALVIPVTVAATVLVLALAGLGAWLLFGNRNNSRTDDTRVDGGKTTSTPAAGSSPAVSPTPSSPSPTPTAAASPVNVAVVRKEVMDLLNGWTESSMARDINAHMSYYADHLDTYYTRTNVSASAVRADRERAYNTYSSLDIGLSNIEITPDAQQESRATAVFDKTWRFEGEDKATSGSVRQKLWLAKIDGRWRITGEKDLQVYYVNK